MTTIRGAGASPMCAMTVESEVASLITSLEDQDQISRRSEQDARRGQMDATRQRVAEMREAASEHFWADAIAGAGEALAGAGGMATACGASRAWEEAGQAVTGGAKLGAAVSGQQARLSEADAASDAATADERGQAAEQARDDSATARKHAEKLIDQLGQLSDAIMQGQLAASRG